MTSQGCPDESFAIGARPVVWFFVRFMLLFMLVMAPWSGLQKAYALAYRAAGNLLFVRFGSSGAVHLSPSNVNDPDRDTEFLLTNRNNGSEYKFTGTSLKGYKPTAFVFCLILATPIPWSRRWRALLWALAFITVYVGLQTVVFLLMAFSADNRLILGLSEDSRLALFTLGPIGKVVLNYLYWVFVESFAGWLLVPVPIWALVCFRQFRWTKGESDDRLEDEAATS